jgi:hypothetical protein
LSWMVGCLCGYAALRWSASDPMGSSVVRRFGGIAAPPKRGRWTGLTVMLVIVGILVAIYFAAIAGSIWLIEPH